MIEQPSNPVTSTTVRRVAARSGLQVSRVRATRPADADSLGNGNWHVWTGDGHRFILRRYHTLRTEQDLSYESQVLRHLAARGWSAGCPRRAALGCDPVRRGPPTPDRDARTS
jgi:Ser/Thr protein kinase RdoA (MazF antagonist)